MLTRCHADRQGVPLEQVCPLPSPRATLHRATPSSCAAQMGLLVKWQADCMRALAANAMPPMPPPGVDMAKMASLQSPSGGGGLAAMSPAPVDCEPFEARRGEQLFGSPVVAEEYASLSRDHAALIKLGESYGAFDAAGAPLASYDAFDTRMRRELPFPAARLTRLRHVLARRQASWLSSTRLRLSRAAGTCSLRAPHCWVRSIRRLSNRQADSSRGLA